MRTFQAERAASNDSHDAAPPERGFAVARCALALVFLLTLALGGRAQAPQLSAQSGRQAPKAQTQTTREAREDEEDGEDEDEARPKAADPWAIMRRARVVYVRSRSAFVNAGEVEDSLRKRKEFRAWGMVVTRNESEADLVIEITRKTLTRRFTFTVIEPRTQLVVTSGKTRSVLFGKKIPNKIAEKFTNRFRAVRPYPPVGQGSP